MEAAGGKNIRPFTVPRPRARLGHPRDGLRADGQGQEDVRAQPVPQSHDVYNLFVMDAASFMSGACQNPTLTIMALAVRSTDYLMGEMKKGNL